MSRRENLNEALRDYGPALDPSFSFTDVGNVTRFVRLHGPDMRFCHVFGKWLLWDETRWKVDEKAEVELLARDVPKELWQDIESLSVEAKKARIAWAAKTERASNLRAFVSLAEADLPVTPEQLDAERDVLNVTNGTLELRTLTLRPHRREDLITKIVPYAYDANVKAPRWLSFLNRIFDGDADLIQYVQQIAGYALTGLTTEQCLFLLHGLGANGKSVLLEVLRQVLGDYAKQAEFSAFLEKERDGIRNDIAALKGARFVAASEADPRRALSESVLKTITGGDIVTARFLHREFFEFHPEFKLFLAANHRPRIRGNDYAIWRRIRLIPFTVTIPENERDPELKEKLLAEEAPGILAWMAEGARLWFEGGLKTPEAVHDATADYRETQDIIGRFLEDEGELGPQFSTPSSALFHAYKKWAETNGEEPGSQRALAERLREHGLKEARSNRARRWNGWRLIGGDGVGR